jgi:4-alpha-glucanotransferase
VNRRRHGRHAGVIVPTFSLRSAADWGIGEIPDLATMAAWLAAAGQGSLHTLPLLERAAYERSPYSALSAFALDPIHVGLDGLEDFVATGGRPAMVAADRATIAAAREHPTIDYEGIRAVKRRAFERAFAHFEATEAAGSSVRARRFAEFQAAESGWLDDYSLYRAIYDAHGDRGWRGWREGLGRRDEPALAAARQAFGRARRFFAYVQWIAHEQLESARQAAAGCDVELIGDLPFTVAVESADVWARQREFDVGVSIGAPPDEFNAAGQDWALPAFRWDVVRANEHAWLRARLAHVARWLDGARFDHVVGYFRTFVRPAGEPPHFEPTDEGEQRALGGAALDVAREADRVVRVVVEDLGDIPPFVREAMAARELPGYRVLRWEGDWPAFRDPRAFPACSIATSGTHDTSALATWWSEELDDEGRLRVAQVPVFAALAERGPGFDPTVHAALVDGLYAAGSDTALLVMPDVFGTTERINTPATVGEHNWTYRLPLTVEGLAGARGRERAEWLRALAGRHRRAT